MVGLTGIATESVVASRATCRAISSRERKAR